MPILISGICVPVVLQLLYCTSRILDYILVQRTFPCSKLGTWLFSTILLTIEQTNENELAESV